MPQRFPVDVTPEEADEGFALTLTEASSGFRAVVLSLGGGLRVIKVRAGNGAIEYVVCDQEFGQLYPSAKSLAELRTRFPYRFIRSA